MIVDGRYRVLQTIRDADDHAEYLTEHQLIGRRMVVKVLHPQAASRAETVMRFVAEAEAAGKLRHPNIVESIDMGFVDGRPFVVFEHLHGTKVSEEIERLGRLPVRRAVHIARQVAAAIAAAHLEEIIHGGLDSDLVYLVDRETDPDFVKVLGLGQGDDSRGLGKTTETLAPEQVLGAAIDHRCDVWTLGVLLYEMIVGRRPFSADVGAATARRRIVSTDAPMIDRPDVPAALVEVIMTCLAKHPDERYQDMAELDAALAPFDVRFARGSSTTIPPLPMLSRVRRPSSPQAVVAIPARTSSLMVARTPSVEMRQPTPTGTQVAPMLPVAAPARRTRLVVVAGLAAAIGMCGIGIALSVTRGAERAPVATPAVAPAGGAVAATQEPTPDVAGARVEQTGDVEVAVDADAPGARVTFRRRVVAAPMTVQVTPADMVELIEVSAPGHKTERYWITVDRPTHIHARLATGDGLVEASELETLVALGETTEPTAPIARDVRAAAPKADHHKRRSVGRGDAPATDDAAPAEPAIAAAADPDPAAAVETAPAAAAQPEPAHADQPAPAGVAPAPAPAPVKTTAAAPRQVPAGFLESNRVAGNAKIVPDNGTRQAMHHQGATKIVGKFKVCVTTTGAVSKVAMVSSSGYADYDKHIMAELGDWKFKPIAIGGEATPVCAAVAIAYSQN